MVVAVAGLVHLVEKDEGHSRSGTTAMLLVAFPTAFFLLADYPDSMALALAVWAFIAVRYRRSPPASAGWCSARAATATRWRSSTSSRGGAATSRFPGPWSGGQAAT